MNTEFMFKKLQEGFYATFQERNQQHLQISDMNSKKNNV